MTDTNPMKIGQIYKASDTYKLYGLIRSEVTFNSFTSSRSAIYHIKKISDFEYIIDDGIIASNPDQIQDFIGRYPDYDMFSGLDATTGNYRFSFGCQDLYASVIFSSQSDYTEIYEDHQENPLYDEYLLRQATFGLFEDKKIAS